MTLLVTFLFHERTATTAKKCRIISAARFVVVEEPTDEAVRKALEKCLVAEVGALPPGMRVERISHSIAVVRS